MKYIVFFALFDWKCLKYIKEIKEKKQIMKLKRTEILSNLKISDEAIYKLFDL